MAVVTKGSRETLMKKARYLADRDDEYVIKVVNGNYELISDLFHHRSFRQRDYTPSELQFLRSVRRYVTKNEIHLKPEFETQYYVKDVHYMKVASVPLGKTFENVFEIDIDEAYWKTAHLLGIISDEIYKSGQKGTISKQARLTSLGSLAKKTYYYHFKGKQLTKKRPPESNPLLENLWFTICKRVSDVMHECIKEIGDEFIFYWVDGIYVQGNTENLAKCIDIFNKSGYEAKSKRIKSISFHDKGFTCNDFGTSKREFNYPKYTAKQEKQIPYHESVALKELADKIINEDFDILEGIEEEAEERYDGSDES